MKSDLIDLEMCIHAETEKAIMVNDDGNRAKGLWLPKSQIEFRKHRTKKDIVEVTMPEWLAKDKGLI